MRKALSLVFVVAMSVVSIACGDGGTETRAGQSGRPPLPEVTTTTTTEVDLTATTLPEEIVEIPDVSDLGLTFEGEVLADEITGDIALGDINQFFIEEAPPLLQPAGTFDELEGDELDLAVEEATLLAPRRAVAVFLGLVAGDENTEMLVADGGNRVIVVQVVEDDSVRAVRYEFNLSVDSPDIFVPVEATTTTAAPADGAEVPEAATTTTLPPGMLITSIPYFLNGEWTQQCQPGRGHQDFTAEPCV